MKPQAYSEALLEVQTCAVTAFPEDLFLHIVRIIMAVRASLRLVRAATTSGEYSPVGPLHSVSKRLVF